MKKYKILIAISFMFTLIVGATVNSNENIEDINNNIVNTTPQALLKSKKWNIMGKSVEIYFEYTNTEEIIIIEGQEVGRSKYYISDTNCFEQNFNNSKIGQINGGRFLVTEESCFYITVIDENTVQISNLSRITENRITTTLIAKP